jgi:hypothetical protein
LHFYDPETKSLRNTQYNIIFNVGECWHILYSCFSTRLQYNNVHILECNHQVLVAALVMH